MNDLPPADNPCRKLPERRDGFVETLRWKPGFDDPDVEQAAGTPAHVIDAAVRYVAPTPWPIEVFLTAAPPHAGSNSGLTMQCEEIGTFLSLLLRHGWAPEQLIGKTKTGALGRTVALFLLRCPRKNWTEHDQAFDDYARAMRRLRE